jgi:hypothetical protein
VLHSDTFFTQEVWELFFGTSFPKAQIRLWKNPTARSKSFGPISKPRVRFEAHVSRSANIRAPLYSSIVVAYL